MNQTFQTELLIRLENVQKSLARIAEALEYQNSAYDKDFKDLYAEGIEMGKRLEKKNKEKVVSPLPDYSTPDDIGSHF